MSTPFYSIEKILSQFNIKQLNEMQEAMLKAAEEHQNLVLLSATGSGKTLAFLLPLLAALDPDAKGTQALIIAPSRELALQIEQVAKKMSSGISVTACYGGHKREIEENNLLEAPTLIVGTPGRLGDHIRRENIKTNTIHTLVLDEFDKSLEFGFEEEMAFITGSLPAIQKRILVSATEPEFLPDFLRQNSFYTVNFLTGEPKETLAIKLVRAAEADKLESLFHLICSLGNRSTIVFLNHRDAVQRTSEFLKEKGLVTVFYHGALEQQERDAALCKFRNGTSNILVTTDLAARGLDIPNIRYIIHYHLPLAEEAFIHRNGRTARMEASGTAILLIGPTEELPPYIDPATEWMELPAATQLPEKPQWTTLHIAGGKKDKINKIDIVGFLSKVGELKKEDIGLIEVKDFFSFVAVRKSKLNRTLPLLEKQKIKGQRVKIEIAK